MQQQVQIAQAAPYGVVPIVQGKSMLASYMLWFFFGWAGGHRFYHGKIASGLCMLGLYCVAFVSSFFLIGIVLLLPLGIWCLIDAFRIPGWVAKSQTAMLIPVVGMPLASAVVAPPTHGALPPS